VLEQNYQRLLVDMILATAGAVRRDIRDEYVVALGRILDETPQLTRYEDPRRDVAAIVAWCAVRRGGLNKLVEAVVSIEEGASAVDRLRAYLTVGQPVEVLQPDEREFVVRQLGDVDEVRLTALLRDVFAQWAPRKRPVMNNPHDVVESLEDSIPQAGDPHPLNIVLRRLAQLLASDELVHLAEQVSDRTGTRGSIPTDMPPPQGGRHYFVVRLTPDGRDASRYLLSVWLTSDDGHWEVRHTSDIPQLPNEIKAEVDGQLIRLAEDPAVEIGELFVEFIVPRSLLGTALDQWITTAPGYSSAIGVHYPVGVRDLTRMRNRLVRAHWRRRCQRIHETGASRASTHFETLNGEAQVNFAEFLQDPDRVCVVVLAPAAQFVLGNVNAWLSAGVPVVLWCRDDSAAERFNSYTQSVLKEGGIKTLPAAVWRLRQDADQPGAAPTHVGRHITLLWDFVDRLPPDDVLPLRGPAKAS